MSEHDEQRNLFAWAEWQSLEWPELRLLFAIPNGGHRNKATAAKMKAEGVKRGVLDIMLPVPVGSGDAHYCGLFIEMKFGKNRMTREQRVWFDALKANGYMVAVCWTAEDARNVITAYLGYEL